MNNVEDLRYRRRIRIGQRVTSGPYHQQRMAKANRLDMALLRAPATVSMQAKMDTAETVRAAFSEMNDAARISGIKLDPQILEGALKMIDLGQPARAVAMLRELCVGWMAMGIDDMRMQAQQ